MTFYFKIILFVVRQYENIDNVINRTVYLFHCLFKLLLSDTCAYSMHDNCSRLLSVRSSVCMVEV